MDERPKIRDQYLDKFQRSDSYSDILDQCTGFLRRQYLVFVIIILCSVGLGLAYLVITPAQYTAKAMLLIDSSQVKLLQPQQQQAVSDAPLDSDQVETQVEILQSEKIALAVTKNLGLTEDPEFVQGEKGIVGRGLGYVGLGPAPIQSEAVRERAAVQTILAKRTVTRIGKTYSFEVGYTAFSPERAAAVANAIVEAYIRDQIDAQSEATRRATDWLEDRIKELQTRALAADRAVLQFKEANHIVDVGGGGGAGTSGGSAGSGRLIADQQVAEISTQLVNARVATSEAKARLERINEIMKHDVGDATVTDSLKDEVITRLRNQYLDTAKQEATWSSRYGPNHQAAVNLRNEMEQLRRSITNELGRIAAGYNSDYEIAKSREDSLQQKFVSLVAAGQSANRDRVGLDELESSAKVYHAIYDNFLQLYREAIQKRSFPITESRIFSPASPPSRKSGPVGSLVMAVAGLLGVIVSFGVAALREASDLAFRTARQVEEALHASCLAMLPRINPAESSVVGRSAAWQADQQRRSPKEAARLYRRTLSASQAVPQGKVVSLSNGLLRKVMEEPFSAFAEGCRAVKIAAELSAYIKKNKVIGITSTMPNEGKSTIACNLAELMADAGKRAILIDTDFRQPTLVRCLVPEPNVGLLALLGGKADLQQVLSFDAETGLSFLPSAIDAQLVHSDEILSSEVFRNLIEQLRPRYDYIILDLPPLGPVVDARAAAQVVDSFVFVVEWGRTRIKVVESVLNAAPEVRDRLLGVVLNKVDIKALKRYEHQYANLYHNETYPLYGYK